jgi:hypothetical protein
MTRRTPSGGSLWSALISFATLASILGAKFSLQLAGPAEVALLLVLRLELLRWYDMWSVPEDMFKNFMCSMICRVLGLPHPLSERWDLLLISNAAINHYLYE